VSRLQTIAFKRTIEVLMRLAAGLAADHHRRQDHSTEERFDQTVPFVPRMV